MADAKLTALTAASALAGADLFYISQGGVSKKATHTQLLTLVGTTYVPLAGGTMTGALTIASGTLTASAPALSITQTWTTGATFTGALMNITDTSSAAGSLFQDWQVGGVSKLNIKKDGSLTWGANARIESDTAQIYITHVGSGRTWASFRGYTTGLTFNTESGVVWCSSTNASAGTQDLFLVRDAAATLALRNSTNAQTFRVYNTYTDSSNGEWGTFGWSANLLDIGFAKNGTGTDRSIQITTGASSQIYFRVGSTVRWILNSSGSGNDFSPNSNNAVDLGTTGSRVRSLYLGTSLLISGNGAFVQTPSMTVANLAAAATAGAGARAFVTDANATTYLSTVAGGGANKVPVVSDGTNWLIG